MKPARSPSRTRSGLTWSALPLLAFVSASSPALAQTGDAAVAEALFRAARTLVAAGSYAEACPKFAESQRIDPKLGTLMNLALCHANEGKTASAWAEYTQAAELASRAGQRERERVARKGAADLEAVLPHIVLRSAANEAIAVSLDGKTMSTAVLGTSLPVDPGTHELAASATGKKPYSQTITVKPGPGEQVITVPPLEPAGAVVLPPPILPAPGPTPPPAEGETSGHPILGYSLIGGGAAAVIVGSIFGGLAFSQKSAANGQCNATQCTPAGLRDVSALKTDEATSTLAIGVGIVAAGAGLFFVLTSKHHEGTPAPTATLQPLIGPGQSGLALSGSF